MSPGGVPRCDPRAAVRCGADGEVVDGRVYEEVCTGRCIEGCYTHLVLLPYTLSLLPSTAPSLLPSLRKTGEIEGNWSDREVKSRVTGAIGRVRTGQKS